MNYRRLGNSNLRVSALCLGTMMFGGQTALADAADIVASARDHGINFIDTADLYNGGQSEKDLGWPANSASMWNATSLPARTRASTAAATHGAG